MSARDSEAIVLRTYPLGEGDRLVSFLGRGEGRMRGVARGARRPKSGFGASLEPLSHVRIWFYERETRDLVRVSQCELIESFWEAQRSYNASLAFGLVAEIAEAALPEREASDPAFRLLLATCRTMKRTALVALPVSYYAIWMLRLAGWLPSLERCSRCHRDLARGEAWGAEDGSGIFCRDCRPGQARPIPAESLVVGRSMLRETLEGLAERGRRVSPELANYLLDLLERNMEKKSVVRSMLELAP